jgi:hypothetical protein
VASEVLHVPRVPSELGHTISYTRIGLGHQTESSDGSAAARAP